MNIFLMDLKEYNITIYSNTKNKLLIQTKFVPFKGHYSISKLTFQTWVVFVPNNSSLLCNVHLIYRNYLLTGLRIISKIN